AKESGFDVPTIQRYFEVSEPTVYKAIKAVKERGLDDVAFRIKVQSLLANPTNGQAKPVSRVDEAVDEEMQSLADALDEDMNKAAEARTATTSRAPRPEDVGTSSEPPSDPVEDAMEATGGDGPSVQEILRKDDENADALAAAWAAHSAQEIDREMTEGIGRPVMYREFSDGTVFEGPPARPYFSTERALNKDGTAKLSFVERLRNAWRALLGKPDPTLSAAWLIGKMDRPLITWNEDDGKLEIYVKGAGTLVLKGALDVADLSEEVARRCGRIIQAMAEKKYLVVVE
ncbi:MAG TPA: hypothetical protein VKA63_04480, partial [Candidatus Krumholzibacteria bacterium]|nr:hypothetical protein [Candidatus Krumholzibacteria bacterium]